MNPSPYFPISVIGAGSMGLLWAGYLSKEGWDVELICKFSHSSSHQAVIQVTQPNQLQFNATVSIVKNPPLSLQKNNFNETNHNKSDSYDTDQLNTSFISLLLIAVKAHQVVDAISSVIDRISPKTHIILLQNGMGSDIELLNRFSNIQSHQLIYAVTTHGAMKYDPIEETGNHSLFKVKHTGFGTTWLGKKNAAPLPNADGIKNLSNMPLINGWVEDIDKRLWRKLLVNAIINPLTALLDCKNGELTQQIAQDLWVGLLAESIDIAKMQGHNFDFEYEKNHVLEVAYKTSMNYSSMHQDIKHHRTTEILYINGFLVQQAETTNIVCPINQLLLAMIEIAQMKPQ